MADFHTLKTKLLSTNQYQFDLSSTALNLQSGEYVTDIRFNFGTVPSNFVLASQPAVYMYVLPNVINGYKLINRTDIGGKYNNEWQTATNTWTTAVTSVIGNMPVSLPKTGY